MPTQPPMGPPGPEMYAPMPMIAPRPDRLLQIGALLLMIFFIAGLLAYHAAFFVGYRGSSDPMVNLRAGLVVTAFVMMDIALGVTVFMTFRTLAKQEASEGTRRGLVLFAAAFLVIWVYASVRFVPLFP